MYVIHYVLTHTVLGMQRPANIAKFIPLACIYMHMYMYIVCIVWQYALIVHEHGYTHVRKVCSYTVHMIVNVISGIIASLQNST